MSDKIQECHNLSLRSVIESYGGRFKGNFFEVPSLWGHESSPSGRIYNKNGIEVYKHYKTGNYGDVIDFVQKAEGIGKNEAINKLLGEQSERKIAPITSAEIQAREMREKALK